MGKRNKEDIEFYTKEYTLEKDEMNDSVDMTPHMLPVEKPNPNAWTSFILGIISSLGWIIPIIGLPVTIVGTVLGAIGMKHKRSRGIAIAGFVINIVFMCASVAKGIVDIVLLARQSKKAV